MNEEHQINEKLLEVASQVDWEVTTVDGILEGFNLVDQDKREVWLALVRKLIKEKNINLLLAIVVKMQQIKNYDDLQFYLSIYDFSDSLYFADSKNDYIANCMVALLRKKKLSDEKITSKQF